MRRVLLWYGLLALVLSPAVFAATLYVDGDNACPGAGTTGDPYCSIQLGMTNASANDTIALRETALSPADYDECANSAGPGGVSTPITLTADSGHNVVVTATCSTGTRDAAVGIHHSHWIVDGTAGGGTLTLDGGDGLSTPYWAIQAEALTGSIAGIVVQNLTCQNWAMNTTFQDGRSPGCIHAYGHEVNDYIVTIVVSNVVIQTVRGIAVMFQSGCDDCILQDSDISDVRCNKRVTGAVAANGMKAAGGPATFPNGVRHIVRRNRFHDFTDHATCSTDVGGLPLGATITAVYCDVGIEDAEVSNNEIFNLGEGLTQNQFYRGVHVEFACHNWIVKNNIVHDIAGAAFHIRDANNVTIAHNTVYNNNNRCFRLENGANAIFRDNICAAVGENMRIEAIAVVEGGHSIDFHSYDSGGSYFEDPTTYSSLASWQGGTTYDDNSTEVAVAMVDPANGNFNLAVGSPAINAGSAGRDIGAFEAPIYFSAVTVDVDTWQMTFTALNSPIQVAGACTGITPREDGNACTASNCVVVGDVSVTFDISGAGDCAALDAADVLTVDLAQGAIADSVDIGGSLLSSALNSENAPATGLSVTNALAGGSTFCNLDQLTFAIRRWGVAGEGLSAPAELIRSKVAGQAVVVPPGSKVQARFSVLCDDPDGADGSEAFALRPSACDGTCGTPANWYVLTSAFNGNLARLTTDPTVTSPGVTTEQLNCGTFEAGVNIDANLGTFPTRQLADGACIEDRVIIEINPAAVAGTDVIKLNLQEADGTDLFSSVDATIYIGNPWAER